MNWTPTEVNILCLNPSVLVGIFVYADSTRLITLHFCIPSSSMIKRFSTIQQPGVVKGWTIGSCLCLTEVSFKTMTTTTTKVWKYKNQLFIQNNANSKLKICTVWYIHFFENCFGSSVLASLGQQPNKIISKKSKFRSDVSQNKKMCKIVDPL